MRRLPNVEVLSLSINNITTLTDFASCRMLQELYLRKNKINDINELLYLIELPDLKKLWLAENPCAEFDNYRMTVLKALPNLEYLDNIRFSNLKFNTLFISFIAFIHKLILFLKSNPRRSNTSRKRRLWHNMASKW